MVICATIEKTFEKERIEEIKKSNDCNQSELLTEKKIKEIPEPIKKSRDIQLIPEKVRIVWHLKDSEYEYYKGTIDRIIFNVNH